MAKLLFSHSYFYKFDPKQWKSGTPYPPLGTLYAAALMLNCNHEVSLFDANLSNSPFEIEEKIKSNKPKYLILYDDCFNYLTKMCLTNMREAALCMIEIAKKYNCFVIVSSSDSTDQYRLYLNKGADFVIIGEGEFTLRDLITNIENNDENYQKINGIAFKHGNEIIKTKEREKITDLDTLPFPAWELVDIESYQKIWKKTKRPFTLNITTTRGCPFHCAWCAKPVYGYSYNARSPEKTIEEIEFLIKRYKVKNFWMCDDIFGLQHQWLRKFKDIIKAKQLNFNYVIQSRVDLLLKADTIDLYSETGLKEIWIGAESGSQKILDSMDKGITIKQIYDTTLQLKQKGIKIGFFLQLGYLGETKDDIAKTIRMIKDLMPDNIGVSVSYPLPGTKFYEQVKNDLKIKSNWIDSDDLALMFRGTYHAAYYKKLHRFIHKEFRKLQAIKFMKSFIVSPFEMNYQKIRTVCLLPYYFLTSAFYLIQIKVLENRKL